MADVAHGDRAEFSWPGDIMVAPYAIGASPVDMDDAQWAQWARDNWMPIWAIRQGLRDRIAAEIAPVLTRLVPNEAEVGSADFRVYIHGRGFRSSSVIVFAGQDKPTTLDADGELSADVDMSIWHVDETVLVSVRNGARVSNSLEFMFVT